MNDMGLRRVVLSAYLTWIGIPMHNFKYIDDIGVLLENALNILHAWCLNSYAVTVFCFLGCVKSIIVSCSILSGEGILLHGLRKLNLILQVLKFLRTFNVSWLLSSATYLQMRHCYCMSRWNNKNVSFGCPLGFCTAGQAWHYVIPLIWYGTISWMSIILRNLIIPVLKCVCLIPRFLRCELCLK